MARKLAHGREQDRRCVSYRRISDPSSRQGDAGRTFDRDQPERIAEIIERQDLELVEAFEDKQSATTNNRPGFQAMLALIRESGIRHLVAYDLDRLTRETDPEEIGKLIKFLQDQQVTVHSVKGSVTPDNAIVSFILLTRGGEENELRRQRICDSYERRRKDAVYHSAMKPYGFRRDRQYDERMTCPQSMIHPQ